MFYGLVLVTSLGTMTLLGVMPDQNECIMRQAMIAKGPNSQAQCLPGPSPEALKSFVKENNEANSKVTVIRK